MIVTTIMITVINGSKRSYKVENWHNDFEEKTHAQNKKCNIYFTFFFQIFLFRFIFDNFHISYEKSFLNVSQTICLKENPTVEDEVVVL